MVILILVCVLLCTPAMIRQVYLVLRRPVPYVSRNIPTMLEIAQETHPDWEQDIPWVVDDRREP